MKEKAKMKKLERENLCKDRQKSSGPLIREYDVNEYIFTCAKKREWEIGRG